jgi:hypothetical protein
LRCRVFPHRGIALVDLAGRVCQVGGLPGLGAWGALRRGRGQRFDGFVGPTWDARRPDLAGKGGHGGGHGGCGLQLQLQLRRTQPGATQRNVKRLGRCREWRGGGVDGVDHGRCDLKR